MVMLESCKGCGASTFDVKEKSGLNFLVCRQCGNDVAILDKEKSTPSPRNLDIIPSSWSYPVDFTVVSSGLCYTGFPFSDNVIIGT